jgi:hypothetical protein
MEQAVLQYLRGEVVDEIILNKLVNEYYYWDTVTQFYCIPILIILVRDSINNTFKSI